MPALPRLLAAVALCLALACATAHGEVHDRRGAADDKALSLVEVEAKVSHPFLSTMTRAFSALSTMTETVTIGNELLSQVPGGSVIGGAINAFLTWLVPQGGTQLASPLLRDLAANTMADIMASVLTALLLLLEALAIPVAAPVAPFAIMHSVMTLSTTTAAAMVGVQRVMHLIRAEQMQHDLCSKVLTSWWARHEADEELAAVTRQVGTVGADDAAVRTRVEALSRRVESLHTAAAAEAEAVQARWADWRRDTSVYSADDQSPLAKTYRLLESLSNFSSWFMKKLADKAMERAWALAATVMGDDSLRPQERVGRPTERSVGVTERTERALGEMARGSALYDTARVEVEDRMQTALGAVQRAQTGDVDPFPSVGGGGQPSTFFGDACIRIYPESTASTEPPSEVCGTVVFAPDRFRDANDGFLFYMAPDRASTAGSGGSTSGSTSTPAPPAAERTDARHRRVAAHFKCLQLQGSALSALSESLSDGASLYEPVQVVAPRVAYIRQLFNYGSESGARSCREYIAMNNVAFSPPTREEMNGGLPGTWRRRLVLYADIEDGREASTPTPGAPVRSITLLAQTYDRDGECKKVARVADVRLRDGSAGDLSPLFRMLVTQLQVFAPSSWDDVDGAMLVGPSIPDDARRQLLLWTPQLHKRCLRAAEREMYDALYRATGSVPDGMLPPPPVSDAGAVPPPPPAAGSDADERGLGICPPLFREELENRVERLRRLTERARLATEALERSRTVANLHALAEQSMLLPDDVVSDGLQMMPIRHDHSRPQDGGSQHLGPPTL